MRRIATKKTVNKKPRKVGSAVSTVKSHNSGKLKVARVTTKPINEPKVK
jgi:hypothetical protein